MSPNIASYKTTSSWRRLRDRTVKIDIPYITKLSEEIKIYRKDFNSKTIQAASTLPRTHSKWRRCGRSLLASNCQKKRISRCCKSLSFITEKPCRASPKTTSKSCAKKRLAKAMEGISPRYIQDKISNALVNTREGNVAA